MGNGGAVNTGFGIDPRVGKHPQNSDRRFYGHELREQDENKERRDESNMSHKTRSWEGQEEGEERDYF